ncbi:hypothetical protein MKEN_00584200 [Mycena kentingensis (nom. inval.)]|nr:hypothetical protein MKEN_00584200 [Mycena kentingensis (nom. inval.)]
MSRRSKESIDKDTALVDVQLALLRSQEMDYQRMLDDIYALKYKIATHRRELEDRRRELDLERVPCHWLPPELLVGIFLVATSSEAEENESYHRMPVTISHVCSRWRTVALGVSRLWARLSLRGAVWCETAATEFLIRSYEAPLEVVFMQPILEAGEESRRAGKLFETILPPHFHRVRSLTVKTRGTGMQRLVRHLRAREFPFLHHLDLRADTLSPSSSSLPSLNPPRMENAGPDAPLRHLRLDGLPLFNMPLYLLSNLVTLELVFPPKKANSERYNSYMFRMSHLLLFLQQTPLLEELLLRAVPYVDVCRGDEEEAPVLMTLPRAGRVELLRLHTLEWEYPFACDVHYFLSFLMLPALETIDIGVEEFTALRPHVALYRGYPENAGSQLWNRITTFPDLRSVTVECLHTDTFSSILRKFTMPMLASLDIAFRASSRTSDDDPPALPRFETLLRDPRLPFLTHLTLTEFTIPADGVTAMLGYLPALEYLSLTLCVGVGAILNGLQRQGAVSPCPHLTELQLALCDDLTRTDIIRFVRIRNGMEPLAAMPGSGSGLRSMAAGGAFLTEKRRQIKKLPRQAQTHLDGHGEADVTARMLSLTLAQQLQKRTQQRIRVLRVDNCAGIGESVMDEVREMGVEDAVWAGTDS